MQVLVIAKTLFGADDAQIPVQPQTFSSRSFDDGDLNGITTSLTWAVVALELILMMTLLLISTKFLVNSCRAEQKVARFIVKLLILVAVVSFSGIFDAFHESPWWKESDYINSTTDIVFCALIGFTYWAAAQWTTWIIAFQFFSTAR